MKTLGLFILIFLALAKLAEASAITVTSQGEPQLIGKKVEVCLCPAGASLASILKSPQEIEFIPGDQDRLLLKRTDNEVNWIKLKFHNPYSIPMHRALMIELNTIEGIDVYKVGRAGTKVIKIGLDRGGSAFFPIIPLKLDAGRSTYYLRVTTNFIPLWYGDLEKVSHVVDRQLTYATSLLMAGILASLGAFGISLLLRNRLFLFYAVYASSTAFFVLFSSNILLIYDVNIFGNSDFKYTDLIHLVMAYELAATLLFILDFLKIKSWSSRLYKVILVYGSSTFVILVGAGLYGYYHPYFQQAIIFIYTLMISTIFTIAVVKRVGNARKGMISWLIYVLGIATGGVLTGTEHVLLGLNIAWASMILEMVLFGYLSVRDLYRHLVQLNKDNNHSYEQLKKLVYPEQIAMMRQGFYLEQTMPVASSEAVVICLDIINSSQIGHSKNHKFFESFLVDCQMLMNSGLEIDGHTVRLFRVKEMGDGFICSLGFPFPVEVNAGNAAVKFVEEVANILWEHAARDLADPKVGLAAGIVMGSVGGFFPHSGIRQYDLYGNAIVLSTRYESMRRTIDLNLMPADSVILMQDKLYGTLDSRQQNLFEHFDLERQPYKIRDDAQARSLWYRVLRYDQNQVVKGLKVS